MHAILASKLFDVPTDQIVVGNGAAELIDILSKRIKGNQLFYQPLRNILSVLKVETKTLSSKTFNIRAPIL